MEQRRITAILNGERLQLNSKTKYLGIILDGKLSWRLHLEKRCRGFIASMGQLRRNVESNCGLRSSKVTWTYESIP